MNTPYVPGASPVSSTAPDVVWWTDSELRRIGAWSALVEESLDTLEASAGTGGGAAWDFDEGAAGAVYGVGTLDLDEGSA